MIEETKPALSQDKIHKAVKDGTQLTILSYTLPHHVEIYIEEVLLEFLSALDQIRLKDYLAYCVRELAVNAKKANTKREYFNSQGLDINNPAEYEKGMQNFKQETLDNINAYLKKQMERGYYIKINLQTIKGIIILEVRNNVEINRNEYVRIHDKLARSRKCTSLEDAVTKLIDPTEGAGLGLIILALMLKKIGLDEECFDIWAERGETIARISFPLERTKIEPMAMLTKEIADFINVLPQFPENITTILKLLSDPSCQLVELARYISTDPALTADLLKLVNSAAYMLPRKVDSLVEAIKLIGMRGIRNLLYSYGTTVLMGNMGSINQKNLWEHSHKTAYFAYNLARNFKPLNKTLQEDAYICGMLHDMGKIVFSELHPDFLAKIQSFCAEKGISSEIFEKIVGGLNHSEVGALIAEKWNFPPTLISSIRWHHEPHKSENDFQDIVWLTYLANFLCHLEEGVSEYVDAHKPILASYNLEQATKATALAKHLGAGFKAEQQRLREEMAKV